MTTYFRSMLFVAMISMTAGNPPLLASDPSPVSLEDAVRMAYESNPSIAATRAQVEASRSAVSAGRAAFFPKLDIEQSLVRTDQPVAAFGTLLNQGRIEQRNFNPDLLNDPDALTDHSTSVILSQPIYNGGQEWSGYQLAKSARDKAEAEARRVTEELLFQVIRSYLGAVLARENKRVTDEALRTAELNLEMIRDRFEQGLVVRSDVLQADVHTAETRERAITAEHQLRLALAGFTSTLGSPSGKVYIPSGDLGGGGCPDVELEQLIMWALADRPELQALQYEYEIAGHMVDIARAPFLPNLNARGSYDYHGESPMQDGADSVTLALSLKFNLFNGTGDMYRVRQARYQQDALRHMKQAQADRVRLDVESAYWELRSATQRLEVISTAVQQAEEGLRIVRQRYEEGVAGILDLQRAELGLSQARLGLLSAQHDLLLGSNTLCRAVGHLYTRWLEPDRCPVPIARTMESEEMQEVTR